MINPIGAALSGLRIFSKRLEVSAQNVANVQTDGYKKSRVVATDTESGYPRAQVKQVNTPGAPYLDPDTGQAVERSNVDLAEEVVEMTVAKHGFRASLKSLETENETFESILDLKA